MSDKMTETMPEAQRLPTTHSAGEGNPVTPMISPMDFAGMAKSTADLIEAVVQTNLRATQELLRAESPRALLALQQRFVREYTAVLMQGTMTFIDAIGAATAAAS